MTTNLCPPPAPALLDTEGAAKYLALSPATLSTWRCTRTVCIPWVRIGRRCMYRVSDLDGYINAHVVARP